MEFPHKCCQCGFCCLAENCIIAQRLYAIPRHGVLCPALIVHDGHTSCLLAEIDPDAMGIGQGCCIKARAFNNGIEYDFASLPPEIKHYSFSLMYKKIKEETHDRRRSQKERIGEI